MPEHWARRLVEKGYTDRRSRQPVPSMKALAEDIGLHPSTVSDLIHGRREPVAENVARLAEKLGADVAEWLGVSYRGRWEPPAESSMLTIRQRRALEELIVSMTTEGGGEHGDRSAPTSHKVNPKDVRSPGTRPGPHA